MWNLLNRLTKVKILMNYGQNILHRDKCHVPASDSEIPL